MASNNLERSLRIGAPVISGTAGSVLFAGVGGILSQDNTNFFWDDTNNFLGLGTAAPAARLRIAGNQTAAAWTTAGIGLSIAAATYTDSSSSGTVPIQAGHVIGRPTFAANAATVYTDSATLYIPFSPAAGGNVTQTRTWGLFIDGGNARIDGRLVIGGTVNATNYTNSIMHIQPFSPVSGAPGLAGAWLTFPTGVIFNDTSTAASGTAAAHSFIGIPVSGISSTNATVTVTDATMFYIAGPPTASTNVTITNPYAFWVDSGNVRFDGRLSVNLATKPLASLDFGGFISEAAWGANGVLIRQRSGNATDTSSSGTVAIQAVNGVAITTLIASSATTYTDSTTFYIADAPTSGNNVTQTNPWAFWVDAGNVRLDGNVVLSAGTSAIGTSATNTLVLGTGTAPGSSPADVFQMYSADITAGNAAPHFRVEAGDIIKLYKVATYTPSNVTTDRSFDANATSIDELADVLGSVIADLQSTGLLG